MSVHHHARAPRTYNLPECTEIEETTANLWLSQGTVTITSVGSENTYYVDQFGLEFYCKNYPQ
jgi:hypothetical protein